MLEIIAGMNTDVLNATESCATDFTSEAMESLDELGETITSLWVAQASAQIAARATNEELRALRAKLGEQLSEMKQRLAKPGRGGQWSSFLEERQIPRATADRLVARHLRSLDPNANCVTEEVSEPTDEDVQKLFAAVWPKLQRTLRSRQSVDLFVGLITSHCEYREPAGQEIPVRMAVPATFDPAGLEREPFTQVNLKSESLVQLNN
jgi:hypothetical protein